MTPIISIVVGGTIAYTLFSFLYRYWRLRKIPGPIIASLTDLWRFRLQHNGPILSVLRNLHHEYGSLVRIGPNTVSIGSAEFVKIIYTNRGEFAKADSYSGMRVYTNGKSVGSIIDMQDEEQNRALKRTVGSAFNLKSLSEYEKDVDNTLKDLIERISHNPTFSLYQTLQMYQLDFLIKIAFSEDSYHLQLGDDVLGLMRLGHKRVSHWVEWQPVPSLESFLFKNPLWSKWFTKPSKWVKLGNEMLEKRLDLNAKNLEEPRKTDLLQKTLDASEKYPNILLPQTVTNLINSIISAGADTTAGTMTTILYFLMKNPAVHRTLLQELQDAKVSVFPRFSDVNGLPYLDSVIKESLRLHPPLPLPLERVVPDQGCLIDGKFLPGGTVIGGMPLLIHLDTKCYGTDAAEFRPERWINIPKQQLLAMERGLLSWGSGNRICLGKHIAELELKKVIPSLLLSFDINLIDQSLDLPFQKGILEFDCSSIDVTFRVKS